MSISQHPNSVAIYSPGKTFLQSGMGILNNPLDPRQSADQNAAFSLPGPTQAFIASPHRTVSKSGIRRRPPADPGLK